MLPDAKFFLGDIVKVILNPLVYVLISALGFLQGCNSIGNLLSPRQKVDSNHLYSSDGFQFRFAMGGEWFVADSQPGFFSIGQRPLEDGSTKLAAVRYGPMGTPGGKPMSNQELIDVFKLKVAAEAKGGKVSDVKTRFTELKYKNASCLKFYQNGVDNAPESKMLLSNDGMICIHPTRPYKFIWMALSERVPFNKKLSDLSDEEKSFFESLDFN
jgi:hypothetical protein